MKAFHFALRRFPLHRPLFFFCALFLCLAPKFVCANNDSTPAGEPVLEPPTLQSVGAYWMVQGDDNANAKLSMAWRKSGAQEWKKSMPMFRVEKGAPEGAMMSPGDNKGRGTLLKIPRGTWLFAGSIVLLEQNTDYELRLSLEDPDGGHVEKILKCHTRAEPQEPADMVRRHVVPGEGGGDGTEQNPFRGLATAQKQAHPGDLFLVHAGIYRGTFEVEHSGEPGRPVVWRGFGDGEAVLDGGEKVKKEASNRVIAASDTHDVWFERLTIRNGDWGIAANGSACIVIRRCHILDVGSGITAERNDRNQVSGFFISDNVLEGRMPWLPPESPEHWRLWKEFEHRGVSITGSGHDVCYNRVSHFKDAMDAGPSPNCSAIDFHHNDCSELIDDGCEMDGSERNTRCFLNRFVNVLTGISVQPVFGGPVYIFRNVIYNVFSEPFKLHNVPSGALFFHNTAAKQGCPIRLSTEESPHHCILRNNLFLGLGQANYAAEFSPTMINCDFDYDGFGGGPWGNFLKWNNVRYPTIDVVRATAPVYHHAILVDPATAFASGLQPPSNADTQYDRATIDMRLRKDSAAIDVGEILPGFNDGFRGAAPEIGAYELGDSLPHYGPRDEK